MFHFSKEKAQLKAKFPSYDKYEKFIREHGDAPMDPIDLISPMNSMNRTPLFDSGSKVTSFEGGDACAAANLELNFRLDENDDNEILGHIVETSQIIEQAEDMIEHGWA